MITWEYFYFILEVYLVGDEEFETELNYSENFNELYEIYEKGWRYIIDNKITNKLKSIAVNTYILTVFFGLY